MSSRFFPESIPSLLGQSFLSGSPEVWDYGEAKADEKEEKAASVLRGWSDLCSGVLEWVETLEWYLVVPDLVDVPQGHIVPNPNRVDKIK